MGKLSFSLFYLITFASFSQNEIPKFILTPSGVNTIVLDMDSLAVDELYKRTISWVQQSYLHPDKVWGETVANERLVVNGYKEKAWYYQPMGFRTYIDMAYALKIETKKNQLLLTFIPGKFFQTGSQKKDSIEDTQKFRDQPARGISDEIRTVNFTATNFF